MNEIIIRYSPSKYGYIFNLYDICFAMKIPLYRSMDYIKTYIPDSLSDYKYITAQEVYGINRKLDTQRTNHVANWIYLDKFKK